jgi:hypothetical protein
VRYDTRPIPRGATLVGQGGRSIAIVGVGMAPRGEVGLIVASLGLSLGAIANEIFRVVVIMSILTTLVVPPVLRVLYRSHGKPRLTRVTRARQIAGSLAEQCCCDPYATPPRFHNGGHRPAAVPSIPHAEEGS